MFGKIRALAISLATLTFLTGVLSPLAAMAGVNSNIHRVSGPATTPTNSVGPQHTTHNRTFVPLPTPQSNRRFRTTAAAASPTQLLITNSYTQSVVVMFVLPQCSVGTSGCNQEDGCPNLASQLSILDVSSQITYSLTQFGAATQGWFNLQPGQTIQVLNTLTNPISQQPSSCLQGLVVGFGQFGNSCPATTPTQIPAFPDPTTGLPANPPIPVPNGSNSFEATLNLPGTINGQTTFNGTNVAQNESTDISCVNGVNSIITVTVTPPSSGPYWNYNEGVNNGGKGNLVFTSATNMGPNSWVDVAAQKDNNCFTPGTLLPRPGVFPFGCTQCNRFPDPAPPCGQFCAVNNGLPPNNGCGFNRSPANGQTFGGSLLVTYGGPLGPPL